MKRWQWLVPILAGLAAFAIAPWGDLVWDDQLVARQQMAAFPRLADVFLPPPGIPQWTYDYYRPLVVLSYVVDQALFGRGAATGPHAMNVLYHLLATGFSWLLARRLLRGVPSGDWGAIFAATVFAVHPLHTESVSWVTGRSDVLAALFLLPGLLAILRWRDTGRPAALAGAVALFLAALLAKEVAIVALVLVPMVLLAAAAERTAPPARPPLPTWLAALGAVVIAAAAYGLLRQAAHTTAGGGLDVAGGEAAIRTLRALGWYLGKLAWPWPQSNFVPWEAAPGVAAAAAMVAVALAAALALALQWRRPGAVAALVGLAWIGATLAPALAVALTGVAAAPLAERYLYLPVFGLALALGVALARAHAAGHARAAVGLGAAVALALGAATVARGQIWLSDLRLWSDAVAKSGEYAVPLIEYGKAQFLAGETVAAARSFERALASADTPRLRATASYNLGIIAATRADMRAAERAFRAAVAADASYAMARYGLGRAIYEAANRRAGAGDVAGALAALAAARAEQEQALRLAPSHAAGHLQLALVLAGEGQLLAVRGDTAGAALRARLALDSYDRARRLEPGIGARSEARELEARLAPLANLLRVTPR